MASPEACGSAAPGDASGGTPKRELPSPEKAAQQKPRKGPAGGSGAITVNEVVTRSGVPAIMGRILQFN